MRFAIYLLTGAPGLERLAAPLDREGTLADGVVTQ
jgi:hypothetical protein